MHRYNSGLNRGIYQDIQKTWLDYHCSCCGDRPIALVNNSLIREILDLPS